MMQPKRTAPLDQQHHQREPPSKAEPNITLISTDKNLMPSMVVRQQRTLATAPAETANSNNNNNNNTHHMPIITPESLASTRDLLAKSRTAAEALASADPAARRHHELEFDQNGLILPRRVPYQHQQLLSLTADATAAKATIRDLNRELKFNQVRGKSVLEQKSELKRAMEKLAANRRRKEAEQERLTRRSSLELRLEERAQRLAARESVSADAPGQQSADAEAAGVMGQL